MPFVVVQCPHCHGRMQVDAQYLTVDTFCPLCKGPLKPISHVTPPPPPLPLSPNHQASTNEFELGVDDSPRRTHHTHQTTGSFLSGFSGALGGCLGQIFALIVLIGLIVGSVFLIKEIKKQNRNNHSETPAHQPKS